MRKQPDLIKGSLLALGAFFCMAIFGLLTREAYSKGNAIWVSFITYAIAMSGISAVILPRGFNFLRSKKYDYLIGRAVFGTVASFLYMLSLKYIPLVNATLLFNTAPIFIPIIMMLWLKKRVPIIGWIAIAIGFLGIAIIIKPGPILFADSGNLLGFSSGFCLAVAYLLIKLLTNTDHGFRIIFYYFSIGAAMHVPLLFFAGPVPDSHTVIFSTLSGIALLTGQFALVKGYTYAEAYQIGTFQYTSLVFVGLIEWFLWGAIPAFTELVGMLLVALSGIVIIRWTNKE